jgi:hypothetical protein
LVKALIFAQKKDYSSEIKPVVFVVVPIVMAGLSGYSGYIPIANLCLAEKKRVYILFSS